MHLDRIAAIIKTGEERLTYRNKPLDFSMLDFWRWSVSDILSNATRGRFAEFLVLTATKIDKTVLRDEWASYDLETPEGIKLEIKSAAYLQSWYQNTMSKISFSIKLTQGWDYLTNKPISGEKKRHADVYVFCLLYHENKSTVDPLNMDQWEFYVLAQNELNEYIRSRHSITLKSIQQLTPAVTYARLYDAIKARHMLNV